MATNVTADGRARVLADGNEIPLLGLGVWQVPDGPRVRERGALGARARLPPHRHRAGVRQRAQRRQGAARQRRAARRGLHHDEVRSRDARTPRPRRERSLERLGVDYVDLYIIHWPQGGPTWAWDGMQRAQAAGYARSIGVSNFGVARDRRAARESPTSPGRQPGQFSPFEFRRGAVRRAEQRGIALEAYSPLGTGRHLGDPRVAAIAERLGRTPAQVLFRWALQRDMIVPAEVDSPRAHRGERAGLRLRAHRRGHGGARRARPHRRDRAALESKWW